MVDRVLAANGPSKVIVQGIREARTAATTYLGCEKDLGGGRLIVYAKLSTAAATAALTPGMLLCSPVMVAVHGRCNVAVTASIGAKEVVIVMGAGSASQDQYADGLMIVECGTGSGYSYKIAGHKPWVASSTAAKVLLSDGLEVALTTASLVTLYLNRYRNVVTKPDCAAATSMPVGLTLCSATATEGSYVWLAKRGTWAARVETAASAGDSLCIGSTAGTLGSRTTGTDTNSNVTPMIATLVCTASVAAAFSLVAMRLA